MLMMPQNDNVLTNVPVVTDVAVVVTVLSVLTVGVVNVVGVVVLSVYNATHKVVRRTSTVTTERKSLQPNLGKTDITSVIIMPNNEYSLLH